MQSFILKGDSHSRRKQYRKICRAFPTADISKSGRAVAKTINGKKVFCEEANRPQTIVIVKAPVTDFKVKEK